MKHFAAVVLGVALVVEVVALMGLGVATGALNTGSAGISANYQHSDALAGSSFGDGMSWRVVMDAATTGQPVTTAMLQGYQSTPESFYLQGYTTGNCGSTGRPTWAPGTGTNYGYYVVQYIVGGVPTAYNGSLDGTSFSAPASGWTASLNGSGIVWWCGWNAAGKDTWTTGLGNANFVAPSSKHTLYLVGLVPSGTLRITFNLEYTYCDGSSIISTTTVCAAAHNAAGSNLAVLGPTGTNSLTTWASVNAYSAGAAVQAINDQNLYNGGKLTVSVSTGYDGPNGYQLYVQCPSPRSCSGGPDPAFKTVSVNNEQNGQTVSWTIPLDYAVNNSAPSWNVVSVTLVANYGVAAQAIGVQIDISPLYDPAVPVVTWTDSSGLSEPAVGDTVTLEIFANATNSSARVGSVLLYVYYLQPGQSATSAPSCGNDWVTTGCPNGQTISVQGNGTNTIEAYTFTVNPPNGATAIGIRAVSETVTAQGKASPFVFINIKQATCPPGQSCDPVRGSGSNLWATLGPVLFSTIILTLAAFAVVYAPTTTFKVVAVAVAGGVIVLMIVLNIFGMLFGGVVA